MPLRRLLFRHEIFYLLQLQINLISFGEANKVRKKCTEIAQKRTQKIFLFYSY